MKTKKYKINWENVIEYIMIIAFIVTLIQSQITLNTLNRIAKEKESQKIEVELTDQSNIQLQ